MVCLLLTVPVGHCGVWLNRFVPIKCTVAVRPATAVTTRRPVGVTSVLAKPNAIGALGIATAIPSTTVEVNESRQLLALRVVRLPVGNLHVARSASATLLLPTTKLRRVKTHPVIVLAVFQ